MESLAYLHLCLTHESPEDGTLEVSLEQFNPLSELKGVIQIPQLRLMLLLLGIVLGTLAGAPEALAQKLGDASAEVTRIQMRLQVLGYSSVQPTGFYDLATQQAIIDFQQKNGLVADGVVGRNTRPILFSPFDPVVNPSLNSGTVSSINPSLNPAIALPIPPSNNSQPLSSNLPLFPPSENSGVVPPINPGSTLLFPPEGVNTSSPPPTPPRDNPAPDLVAANGNFIFPGLVLRRGSRGEEVRVLQQQLGVYGYPVSVDGVYGLQTESAVARFQADRGIFPDGVAGEQTLAALGIVSPFSSPSTSLPSVPGNPAFISSPPPTQPFIGNQPTAFFQPTAVSSGGVLRRGSQGEAVRVLQRRLRELGYYRGSLDGIYGLGTENAVSRFQAAANLFPDGVAGERTLSALGLSDIFEPEDRRYVVVVPGDNNTLREVQRYVTNASLNSSRRGVFVNAGQYSSRNDAESLSYYLRARGLDARVAYNP